MDNRGEHLLPSDGNSPEFSERPTSELLFHGTTLSKYRQSLQKDGTYKNPEGYELWLDESAEIPLAKATGMGNDTQEEGILLIINPTRINVQKPEKAEKLNDLQHWTTETISKEAFIAYNLTQDPARLFEGDEQERLRKLQELCEPLGIKPTKNISLKNQSIS